MQKYIEVIQPSGETFLIKQAVVSNFEDALSGELTLSFTVKMKDILSFSSDSVLRYGGQYFRISSFTRSISSGEYLISVEAEHESFILSDKSLDLEKFEFSGSASDALALILSGTGMAGYIENDVQVEFDKAGTVTRRHLLKELVSLCGGELEYEGHDIRIVNHRGSSSRYDILAAMGINLKKQWMATLDGRTRHTHAALDGVVVERNEEFANGCMYPGDPRGAPAEVYNCRCTMIAVIEDEPYEDAQRRARSEATGRNYIISDMSYDEWEKWKTENAEKQTLLQKQEKTDILKGKIRKGDLSTKLSHQQYIKHILNSPQYEQYKETRLQKGNSPQSVLYISETEAQELIKKHCTTGDVTTAGMGKEMKFVEYCDAEKELVAYYSGNEYLPTKRFAIHYSKRSAHIVPVKSIDKEKK